MEQLQFQYDEPYDELPIAEKWARNIDAYVAGYTSTYPFVVSQDEREAIAMDIMHELVEQNALSMEEAYDALIVWRGYGTR